MKERINISIDSEIAKKMRREAIEKYGSLRSFSQLIEDTYTHKNQGMDPELSSEEMAVLDKVPDATYPSSKGTSCSTIWDQHYHCEDCDIIFELLRSEHAPTICPHCESRRLKKHVP